MKKLAIIIVLFFAIGKTTAQEISRSGESYLKLYAKNIEKLKVMDPAAMGYEPELAKAEKTLNNLKVSDPSYDQSSQRKELQSYKDKLGKATSDEEVSRNKKSGFNSDIEKFLYKKTDHFQNAGSEEDIGKVIAEVDDFEKTIQTFVGSSGDQSSNLSGLSKAENAWKIVSKDDGVIYYAEKNGAKESDPVKAKAMYYQIKLIKVKWQYISNIFPKSNTLAEAAKRCADVLSALGDPSSLAKKANETKAANLANVKMEPATASDPALETQIKKALGESKIAGGKQVVKINLHNKDWNIKRHAVSGVILSRSKNFSAVVKEKDGKCTLIQYTSYKQEHDGKSYGEGYIYMGQANEILCENVK